MQANQIVAQVYRQWRGPSQDHLSMFDVFLKLQLSCRKYAQKLARSQENPALGEFGLGTPNAQKIIVPGGDTFQLPTKVETRPLSSTPFDQWTEVAIVNKKDFNAQQRAGRDCVTFWGAPPVMEFSLDVTGRTFNLYYPLTLAAPSNMNDLNPIGQIWDPLIMWDTALSAGPLIKMDGYSEQAMASWYKFYSTNVSECERQLESWERMFQDYLDKGQDQVAYKTGFHDRTDPWSYTSWPRAL